MFFCVAGCVCVLVSVFASLRAQPHGQGQPMLDLLVVFTKGGIVLWLHRPKEMNHIALISRFVQTTFIDMVMLTGTLIDGALELCYTVSRDLNLVFLAAYQRILPMPKGFVERVLEQTQRAFVRMYGARIRSEVALDAHAFDPVFQDILRHAETEKTGRIEQKKEVFAKPNKKTAGRMWEGQVSKASVKALDYSSEGQAARAGASERLASGTKELLEIEETEAAPTTQASRLWGFVQGLAGQKELTQEDVQKTLDVMLQHLVEKNVAAEVASTIVSAVGSELVGRKPGTFQTIRSLVCEATEKTLRKILQSAESIDVLGEIQVRDRKRPYVVAFVGVNGVGKSTSLAKVCYWLLQNDLRVLVAACDTFRSGAVEQLRIHVQRLASTFGDRVALFERGYDKDAALVAKHAVEHATLAGYDVLLVDTAGRMQDNAPLMSSLARLVHLNRPDKLVFVGEALVGNEAVDQLRKFQAALRSEEIAGVNGILVTKFDAVEDKMGAAVSMAGVAGAPILFVGVGQTYADLRRLNVRHVVNMLLA